MRIEIQGQGFMTLGSVNGTATKDTSFVTETDRTIHVHFVFHFVAE
jgi:hypothetical protein